LIRAKTKNGRVITRPYEDGIRCDGAMNWVSQFMVNALDSPQTMRQQVLL